MRLTKLIVGVACASVFTGVPGNAQTPSSPTPRLADIPIHHVGVIVRDVAKAATLYAEVLGVPVPPIQAQTGIVFPADYTGDRKAYPKVAMFQLNGVAVEMLEPMGGASPWRDHMEKYGEGLHHIALHGVKVAEAAALAVSKGGKQVIGGPGSTFAAVDLRSTLGFTLELNEPPAPAAAPAPTAASGKFVDNPVAYVSVIVPEMEKSLALFSELMGVPVPKIADPKIVYPQDFAGDREGHPRLAMVGLSGLDVAFTSPVGGKTPWRDNVEKYGPAIHHLGIRITGMADQIAAFERRGARLIIGGPALGYSWLDLSPQLPMIFELNGK